MPVFNVKQSAEFQQLAKAWKFQHIGGHHGSLQMAVLLEHLTVKAWLHFNVSTWDLDKEIGRKNWISFFLNRVLAITISQMKFHKLFTSCNNQRSCYKIVCIK